MRVARTRSIVVHATLLLSILLISRRVRAETAPAAVPKGAVTHHTFEQSKIFPGTVRDYWVYVPAQYDGSKPACLWVCQDGIQYNAPDVFDQLIAAHDMPVTIGIFVMHGKVSAPNADALDRFNRSYEYDGLGPNYARFLLDELLPHIASDQKLNWSASANDRAIGGSSSGAVCAFTAAWERPDAFSRVFSSVGTYVGLRGGNEYPTLIRKTEPKPLRVFLQDGTHDANIWAGDWWMANNEMERSLSFAGYEVNHIWGEGGHDPVQATQIFPDAMRWLWKDWPAPVKAGHGSPQLQDILLPEEGWQLVGEGYKFAEGPAVTAKGDVYFNDPGASIGYRLDTLGKPQVFVQDSRNGDGQAFGPDGRLYTCAGGANEIRVYGPDGKFSVVASGFRGDDLVVLHNGNIYVTEPGWNGVDPGKVWLIDPRGEKKVVDIGLKFPNGVTVSPDQTLLYVDDTKSHWVWSYQIQPDGTLAAKQKYFWLHDPDTAEDSGADGMRCDREGRLYVATRLGIQVCDQAGRVNCIIPTPNGQIANLCFGGEQFDTIYAACGNKVFKRHVKVHGVNAFEAPIKPAPPRL